MPETPSRDRFSSLTPLCALLVALFFAPVAVHADERPPNILLIMADDMGYECLGANGSTSYETPFLDKLAASGMRFEHCYSQPICTPSRVQLMTGIYNQRNYIRFGVLDPKATTFAQVLKKRGYRTFVGGKWQLRGGERAPQHFGFDEHSLWQLTVRKSRYPNPTLEANGTTTAYSSGEYGPDLVTDAMIDFMRRNKEQPFLAYYPMILPHWPFEPTPDSADWDPKAVGVLNGQGKPRYFADMVKYTDKMVGKLVHALDGLGLRGKTLILFTCDNGTATSVTSRMGKLAIRGGKGSTTDAGTRVPFVASWPGVIPAGKVNRDLIDFSDFFPTLLDAAGAQRPAGLEIDGRSFLPQLRGEKGTPREWIYCWYARNGGKNGRAFIRDRRYKLYESGEFYDVTTDRLEKRNLSDTDRSDAAKKAHESLDRALEKFRGTRTIFPKGYPPKKAPKKAEKSAKSAKSSPRVSQDQAVATIRETGGHVFLREGKVVEVQLNRARVDDDSLTLVALFPELTDISLEETPITDRGLAHLSKLRKVEWLNLYRTKIGDAGLESLSHIGSLKFLPIGETGVTDKGLEHLRGLSDLEYLGLRATKITDTGLDTVARLTTLRGLHVGETKVTDRGVQKLASLTKLEKLWLNETSITDASVDTLVRLERLQQLDISGTRLSADAVRRLTKALPRCRITRPDL